MTLGLLYHPSHAGAPQLTWAIDLENVVPQLTFFSLLAATPLFGLVGSWPAATLIFVPLCLFGAVNAWRLLKFVSRGGVYLAFTTLGLVIDDPARDAAMIVPWDAVRDLRYIAGTRPFDTRTVHLTHVDRTGERRVQHVIDLGFCKWLFSASGLEEPAIMEHLTSWLSSRSQVRRESPSSPRTPADFKKRSNLDSGSVASPAEPAEVLALLS
jgi:hypothetical protein